MSRTYGFRVILLLVLAGRAAGATEYRVSIERSDLRLARVEARLAPTEDGELLLTRNAADTGIDGGWARFLENLRVWDAEGEPVAVETGDEGTFLLDGARGPVRVSYSMRLEHDRVDNLPGADELAWARPEAVMWSGRALFLEGAPDREIGVAFDLPDGWRATTPWKVIEPGLEFRAETTDALLDAAFVVGTHEQTLLGAGDDAPVRIALAGPNAASREPLIVETVERYLGVFGELFGAPPEGRLLLVVADGDFWGGGVMGTTISMMLGGPLDDATLPMLRFVTIHEAFHLWNANFRYRGREGKESLYWLSEGTASYYTLRSQLGAGDLPVEAALGQIADEVKSYRSTLGGLSMVAGGPTKLTNYDLIYSGGFVASMALDIAIRTRSEDRYSLDDVMRSLHSGSGREPNLDVRSLVGVVRSATGVPVADLIDCCVDGTEELPLVELFRQLGLALRLEEDSVVVEPVAGASPEASARWQAWPLR